MTKKVVKKAQKQRAWFHVLCVNMGKCTVPNNLNQPERPNFTYAEGLVKFGLYLDVLWVHEKSVTFVTDTQTDRRTQLNFIIDYC